MKSFSIRGPVLLATALVTSSLALGSAAGAAVGQLDDFQDGGFGGWDIAGLNTYAIVNNAGPAGAGDNALEIEFSQRIVFFNEAHWSGNYAMGGVTRVAMDIQHSNPFNLELRIGISKGPDRPLPGGNGDTYITD